MTAKPSAAEQSSACTRAAEMLDRARVALNVWRYSDQDVDDTRAALSAAAASLMWIETNRDAIACAWACAKLKGCDRWQ